MTKMFQNFVVAFIIDQGYFCLQFAKMDYSRLREIDIRIYFVEPESMYMCRYILYVCVLWIIPIAMLCIGGADKTRFKWRSYVLPSLLHIG